jgi:hypothetical protein
VFLPFCLFSVCCLIELIFLFPQCTIRIRLPRCDAAVSRQTLRTAARATTPPPLPPKRPDSAAAIPVAAVPRKAPPPTTKIGTEYRPTYPAALGISDVDPDLFRRWSFWWNLKAFHQCCGSGLGSGPAESACFWASRNRIRIH